MRNSELDAAYRATDYRVTDAPNGAFVIRVGEYSFEMEDLMLDDCVFEWAFVTACNPGSHRMSAEENARRMAALENVVGKRFDRYYHGEGVGRDGSWPPEPSLLVLGISEAESVELGRRFGQNAVVVGRAGERTRLVWVE